MKEGTQGSRKIKGEKLAPEGSIDYIKHSESWEIKYDPKSGNFYFRTSDYHPGDLELTVDDLQTMIKFSKLNKK